jgi:hypothetical protein
MGFFYHVNSDLCVAATTTSDSFPAFSNGQYILEPCNVCGDQSGVPPLSQMFCNNGGGCMLFQGDCATDGWDLYSTTPPGWDDETFNFDTCTTAVVSLDGGFCIEWPNWEDFG